MFVFVLLCSVNGLGSRLSRSPSAFWWLTFFSGSVSVCCRGCVFLVLSFCSFGALPLEASCSWIMIWLHGCCCSKELGVRMLRVDGVVVCEVDKIVTRKGGLNCDPLKIILKLKSESQVVYLE